MAFIELVVHDIRTSMMNQDLLILKEKNGDRYLHIWIVRSEADAIAVKLQNIDISRPLTHDLLFDLIQLMKCKVSSALISDLRNDTFYAYLIIEREKKKYSIDCRPSDAIAVAIRAMAPIFTTEEVVNKAAIVLNEEADTVSKNDQTGKINSSDCQANVEVTCPKCGAKQPNIYRPYGRVCFSCGFDFKDYYMYKV
jgi:hypothetical protein